MAHLFFGITFIVIGILIIIFFPKVFKIEKKDYSQYPTAAGTILHTYRFYGERWVVCFEDADGNEAMGMDDIRAASVFHPENYHMPKKGRTERIYYWPYNGPGSFSINNQPVKYEVHFCDEDLYSVEQKKIKRASAMCVVFGIFMIVCGLFIMLR